MIDTVILEIPQSHFSILDKDSNKWSLVKTKGSFKALARNFPKNGIYRPRLTLIKRANYHTLKIEFSVPKLLYNNNLQEVSESDLNLIIDTLQNMIRQEYGIKIFNKLLKNAKVTAFHASKNILFSDSYRSTFIIKEISKINFSLKMDKNKSDFRNDGESFQIYSQAHSFVIYDKIKDFRKTKNRAIDKDPTITQRSIFDLINKNPRVQEVLRFEVRLSNKRKMNAVLKTVGHPLNPTFQDLFKNNLCQDIVLWYWDNYIIEGNKILFLAQNNPKEILAKIITANPKIKMKEAIYLVGLICLAKDSEGIRDLRNILSSNTNKRTWYRVANDLKNLGNMLIENKYPPWAIQIEKQLQDFIPLMFEDNEYGLRIFHNLECKEK